MEHRSVFRAGGVERRTGVESGGLIGVNLAAEKCDGRARAGGQGVNSIRVMAHCRFAATPSETLGLAGSAVDKGRRGRLRRGEGYASVWCFP